MSTTEEPVREWVGGRLTLPSRIESMGDRRAEMSIWVELPDLHVVGHVLEDPEDPQATFGQSLMRAMASPLVGDPRRPQRVRVADPALATQLDSFSFLSVEVAPTPELDRVVRALVAFVGEASYFTDPSLTASDIEAFFEAARVLWAAHPWTMVDDESLVHIEVPAFGIEDGCVSIVGSLGEVRGFAWFPSYEDYAVMIESTSSTTPGEPLAPHGALYFSFTSREGVPASMRDEVAEHGWTLADDNAYPMLLRLADGKHAPVRERDLKLAKAIMRALGAFVLRHSDAFKSYGEVAIRESQRDEHDLELILSVPHPLVPPDGEPPRAQTLSAQDPYSIPLPAPQLEALTRTLGSFTLHRAVGLFCAVVCVPRLPPPSVWLGAILQELTLVDKAHAQKVVDQLMLIQNHVVSTIEHEGIDGLVPEAADVEACREWARGFSTLLGMIDPKMMAGDVLDAAFPIQVLAEIPQMLKLFEEFRGDRSRDEMLAQYRESLADDADFLLEAWADERARSPEPAVRRSALKVGRNDPCPCGSGKKYKKCCAVSP